MIALSKIVAIMIPFCEIAAAPPSTPNVIPPQAETAQFTETLNDDSSTTKFPNYGWGTNYSNEEPAANIGWPYERDPEKLGKLQNKITRKLSTAKGVN